MKTLGSFTLILSLLSVGFAMDKTCMWVMNVLEMITHSGNAVEFRISSNTVRAESSYFVRLRISCKNQVRAFYHLFEKKFGSEQMFRFLKNSLKDSLKKEYNLSRIPFYYLPSCSVRNL